jgi:hypothetical protein
MPEAIPGESAASLQEIYLLLLLRGTIERSGLRWAWASRLVLFLRQSLRA